MAKFSFNRADMGEYINKLAKLGDASVAAGQKGIYNATKIYADELRNQTATLPTQEGRVGKGAKVNALSKAQKDGLLKSIDIYDVKSKTFGLVQKSVGFVGYNGIQTKKYPQGQPNRLIAASVNSGSSVRQKNPFIRRTRKATHDRCIKAMKDAVDEAIDKLNLDK